VTQSIIIAAFIMMAGLALMGFATLFGRVAVEPVRTTGNKRRFTMTYNGKPVSFRRAPKTTPGIRRSGRRNS
jgi:hypothetical protein